MATSYFYCPSLQTFKGSRRLLSVSGHHNNKCDKSISLRSSTPHLSTQLRNCRPFHTKANYFRHGGKSLNKMSIVRAAAAEGGDNDDGAATDSAATKGRQLWRSELESTSESLDGGPSLERDIERFTKKEEMERLWSQADRIGGKKEQAEDERGAVVRDVVDKILVADFFFILFILAWLLAGLAEQTALESSILIDSWLPLWPSVFQPALGVFMAGAIVSAITKKR
ncbi:unnamed protein product [Calypogeia fissa]